MPSDPNQSHEDWESDYIDDVYIEDDDFYYEENVYVDELDDGITYYDDEFMQEMKDILDEYEERRLEEDGRD